MIDFNVLASGNLEITCEAADKEDLQDLLDRCTHRDHGFLADLLEHTGWSGNGKLYQVQPEWVAALTDAPILTDDLTYPEDSGMPEVTGTVWWYPDYMVKSFAEELISAGRVTFTKGERVAPENGEGQAKTKWNDYTVTVEVTVHATSPEMAAQYALDDLRDTSIGPWNMKTSCPDGEKTVQVGELPASQT